MPRTALIEQLRLFETPLLANTIDYIHPPAGHYFYLAGSIESVTPSLGPTVGAAVTCLADTSTPSGGGYWDDFYAELERIERTREPVVWVVKTVGSRPEHECVLGDGMGRLLHTAGCEGIVTDGGVRDIPGLLRIPFAAYARFKTVHHTPMRFTHFNEPVEIGGVIIDPGDVIHASAEGVIRIPDACLEQLPEAAIRMQAFEREAHCVFVQSDLTVQEKRRRVGEMLIKYGFAQKAEVSRVSI